MKKSRSLAIILAAMLLPSPAFAEGWYVRAEGGVAAGRMDFLLSPLGPVGAIDTADLDLKPGFQVFVAAGRDLGQGFRLETASLYTWTPVDGVDAGDLDVNASLLAGLVQGSYVFKRESVSPFIGAGLGYGLMRLGSTNGSVGSSVTSDGMVWRAGSGAEWQVTENTVLTAGYWYTSGDFELFDPTVHALTVGAKIQLNPH